MWLWCVETHYLFMIERSNKNSDVVRNVLERQWELSQFHEHSGDTPNHPLRVVSISKDWHRNIIIVIFICFWSFNRNALLLPTSFRSVCCWQLQPSCQQLEIPTKPLTKVSLFCRNPFFVLLAECILHFFPACAEKFYNFPADWKSTLGIALSVWRFFFVFFHWFNK